jgi:hypothetical protein
MLTLLKVRRRMDDQTIRQRKRVRWRAFNIEAGGKSHLIARK